MLETILKIENFLSKLKIFKQLRKNWKDIRVFSYENKQKYPICVS